MTHRQVSQRQGYTQKNGYKMTDACSYKCHTYINNVILNTL